MLLNVGWLWGSFMLQSNWSLVSCNNWNIDMNKRATLIKLHCNFFMDWYFYTIFILYLWAIDSFSIGSDSRKELKNQIKKIQWHWGLNRYRGVHLPLSIQWLSSLKWLMCTHKLQILLVIIFSLPHPIINTLREAIKPELQSNAPWE